MATNWEFFLLFSLALVRCSQGQVNKEACANIEDQILMSCTKTSPQQVINVTQLCLCYSGCGACFCAKRDWDICERLQNCSITLSEDVITKLKYSLPLSEALILSLLNKTNVKIVYTCIGGEKSISTSPWIISAVVACVVIIILVTVVIYCLRRKQTNHVTKPTNQSTLDQTMSSHGSSSANIIPDQQPVNTSNMNQIGFDSDYLTFVGQINSQPDSKDADGVYEVLDD